MADTIAPGAWFQQLDDALPKLKAAGTAFYTSKKLVKINNGSVEVSDTHTGVLSHIECDAVVLSLGVKPQRSLYDELKSRFKNVYIIGDCDKPGRIFNATNAAFELAARI